MGFSSGWDSTYRTGQHMSEWPWSDLVSLVHRHAKPENGYRRVLELGCGAGANIPFLQSLGMDYCAVEGSSFIVARLRARFPEIAANIVVGDFTQKIPFTSRFDLVIDRASVTHNTTTGIRRALALVADVLRSGGKLIGLDWFAADHSAAKFGTPLDSHTRTGLSGTFTGIGAVHFSDRQHLLALMQDAGLSIEHLAHKEIKTEIPADGERMCSWNFVASKA